MALLSAQQVGITGTQITYTAPTAGASADTVAPDDRAFYHVKNGAGVATTVTIVVPGSVFGQARADITLSIPAGQERAFGPLVQDLADPTTGLISLGAAPQASVTAAVVRI